MNLQNILLVDDDPSIRRVAEISLSRIGKLNVQMAESGINALNLLLNTNDCNPDLILLDVMMPGLDGPRTLAQLKMHAALRNIPVIFMTAKIQKHEVQTYFDMGVIGVINKPFDPVLLPLEVKLLFEHSTEACVA